MRSISSRSFSFDGWLQVLDHHRLDPGMAISASVLRDVPHAGLWKMVTFIWTLPQRASRGEMLMDLRDDRGAFADRAADALDRARAHVADGEHAGHARLERRGRRRRPSARLARR